MTETGTIADTALTQIVSGSGNTATIQELSFHNTGGSDCWLKVFWRGVQNRYVELGPNEVVEMFTGKVLEPTDAIRAQAALPNVITWDANVKR